ncbi:hypothetical protein [Candidatus Epulonipiscium viviparus]|uniref:hypothetical protein n=1 Tax=Candidatus Epulonipiscium viviparus TaxID=420336 RepID=UPI00273805E9|nr:hypothetical protein [Candidatus Epulopiscium viviparus]
MVEEAEPVVEEVTPVVEVEPVVEEVTPVVEAEPVVEEAAPVAEESEVVEWDTDVVPEKVENVDEKTGPVVVIIDAELVDKATPAEATEEE